MMEITSWTRDADGRLAFAKIAANTPTIVVSKDEHGTHASRKASIVGARALMT